MFFSSIKEINRLLKEINRLLSKGTSNIYLEIAIEKNWLTQNFDLKSLKSLSPDEVSGVRTHADIIEFPNFFLRFKNPKFGS